MTPNLWRRRWQILAWGSLGSFALWLAGVGYALHAWLPPVPR